MIGKHKGERAFIVGNGSSLNELDLEKMRGSVLLGSNNIYLHDTLKDMITYFVVEDTKIMRNFVDAINAYKGPLVKYFPAQMRGVVTTEDVELINFSYKNPDKKFVEGDSFFWCGCTVSYLLMQIAFVMGCDPVYLVGFSGDGHFVSEEEYYKGKSYNPCFENRVLFFYDIARKAFEQDGRRIMNASPGDSYLVDAFDRVDYEQLFV